MKRLLKLIGNIFFIFLMAVLLLSGLYLVSGKISGVGVPTIREHRIFTVLSGSMEPAFAAGDIVLVKSTAPQEIKKGDIITFKSPSSKKKIITHRVTKVIKGTSYKFETRGDANDAVDTELISSRDMIGRVNFSLPYLGFLFNFCQTKTGFIILIVVPALILIGAELKNIFLSFKETDSCQKTKEPIHE